MRFLVLLGFASILFLLFPLISYAALNPGNENFTIGAPLNPANLTFTIQSIYLQPDSLGYILYLQGDPTYLNIYWNVTFAGGSKTRINVQCYFNCNISTSSCSGFQSCSYSGPTGVGVCTITNPSYNQPLNRADMISCNFTDPENPSVEYKFPDGSYPSRSFIPIDFELRAAPTAATVGTPVSLPITLQNVGLFAGSFNVTLYSISGSVAIDPPSITNPNYIAVGPLNGQSYLTKSEAASFPVEITALAAFTRIRVGVLANSTIQPQIYKEDVIDISTGFASLSEFHLEGVIQIILFSTILLLVAFSKKKLFK